MEKENRDKRKWDLLRLQLGNPPRPFPPPSSSKMKNAVNLPPIKFADSAMDYAQGNPDYTQDTERKFL